MCIINVVVIKTSEPYNVYSHLHLNLPHIFTSNNIKELNKPNKKHY